MVLVDRSACRKGGGEGPVIYLASSSPRRRTLLKAARLRFKIVRPTYKEVHRHSGSAERLTQEHALGKAFSVMGRVREGVILGADTVVVDGRRILGKPPTLKEAEKMLGRLQGRWHTVVTSVALIRMGQGWPQKKCLFIEKTKVRLKKMDSAMIRRYLKKIGPLDKAGAYAAQTVGEGVVERVKGSFTNVVGLPIEKLKKNLRVLR